MSPVYVTTEETGSWEDKDKVKSLLTKAPTTWSGGNHWEGDRGRLTRDTHQRLQYHRARNSKMAKQSRIAKNIKPMETERPGNLKRTQKSHCNFHRANALFFTAHYNIITLKILQMFDHLWFPVSYFQLSLSTLSLSLSFCVFMPLSLSPYSCLPSGQH